MEPGSHITGSLLLFRWIFLSTEPPEKPQSNKCFLCDEKELEKSVDVNFIGASDRDISLFFGLPELTCCYFLEMCS